MSQETQGNKRSDTTRYIAFANQKGGVGKTTSAVTLAHGLARLGRRTLLVDLDPQGHVAFALGQEKGGGVYGLICEDRPLAKVVQPARPNLDILPGNKQTELVKRHILTNNTHPSLLLEKLQDRGYEYVMFDLAPSMDVLHVYGLVASDWVIIPTRLDALAVDGVKEILLTMGEVGRRGYTFRGYSIVPTFFDRTTRETLTQFKLLVRTFTRHVWPPIPQDTRAREAAAYGKTLYEYAPSSQAIRGYPGGHDRLGGYQKMLERLLEALDDR